MRAGTRGTMWLRKWPSVLTLYPLLDPAPPTSLGTQRACICFFKKHLLSTYMCHACAGHWVYLSEQAIGLPALREFLVAKGGDRHCASQQPQSLSFPREARVMKATKPERWDRDGRTR